jgi:hypothetical protein
MSSNRKLFLFVAIPLIMIFAGLAVFLMRDRSTTSQQTTNNSSATGASKTESITSATASSVSWSFDGSAWRASGKAPTCSDPLALKTPVDLTKATAVLYPGQTRGGNYKPHGGFIFNGSNNADITVTAPMDAVISKASRYIEQGETQYLFVLTAPCGISYRFDHLLTLSDAFQKVADGLPAAAVDDSRTTAIDPPIAVKAGDTVATAVGFTKTKNVSVDFGVYDLRKTNGVTPNTTWASLFNQDKESAPYGVCWFDVLSAVDGATVRALPAGDQTNGKMSDYCK